MAGSPKFKVYDSQGRYQASCKEPEAAAALMGFYGDGATIRLQHKEILWREGDEGFPAADSYDSARDVIEMRMKKAYEADPWPS